MNEPKLGRFGQVWNLLWLTVLVLSILFALWAFSSSNDSDLVKVITFFTVVTSALATTYQVIKKKPDGFLHAIKDEFLNVRNTIEDAVSRAVNQISKNTEQTVTRSTDELREHMNQGFASLGDALQPAIDAITNNPQVNKDDEELAKIDLKALKQLFRHINYDNIQLLLQGYADGRVLVDVVDETDEYFSMRHHLDFRLYNTELEGALSEFDSVLSGTLSAGMMLFGPPLGSEPYTHFTATYTLPWAKASASDQELNKHREFVEQHVVPTWKVYLAFIDKLRSRGIYHKLSE